MKARHSVFIVLIFGLLATAVVTMSAGAGDDPMVPPPLEQMLRWAPERDRTLVVTFPGILYRYEILDWKPAPACQTVTEVVGTKELRWITHAGWMAHQYLTKNSPMAFRRPGDGEWHWMSRRTNRECVQYDFEKLRCKKWRD